MGFDGSPSLTFNALCVFLPPTKEREREENRPLPQQTVIIIPIIYVFMDSKQSIELIQWNAIVSQKFMEVIITAAFGRKHQSFSIQQMTRAFGLQAIAIAFKLETYRYVLCETGLAASPLFPTKN